ncbi:MAG: hypothetical protein M2R45_02393 [Verrucomicrobia subdivision 3 bacterium]|nr:hypothetical protein [Limisphaerales bacterium]MCS1416401.1 hypothetical protein [Limisphaerales bacterium]
MYRSGYANLGIVLVANSKYSKYLSTPIHEYTTDSAAATVDPDPILSLIDTCVFGAKSIAEACRGNLYLEGEIAVQSLTSKP